MESLPASCAEVTKKFRYRQIFSVSKNVSNVSSFA